MESPDAELVEHLAVVEIRPGDTLVLMHPGRLSQYAASALTEIAQRRFPDNRIVVLEEGMTLGVLRPAGLPS